MIDTTFTQEFVDDYYKQNTSGEHNAISNLRNAYPDLNIKKELDRPQVRNGLSHFELVQDIEVSPNSKTIVSIDKFNILKIWDKNGEILNSLQITNNKKDTEVYFISDSTLLVTPNIILNIHNKNHKIIDGFEKHKSIAFDKMIYFYFDYNNESRPEKLYNLETTNVKNLNLKLYYTLNASRSRNRLALLGVDGLIRVINKNGDIISTFGKDRNEINTFRGEKINSFSNICQIGFSPNGEYLISGNENGKIIIWKYE